MINLKKKPFSPAKDGLKIINIWSYILDICNINTTSLK